MATHQLKTWPVPFRAVLSGKKRYEIRKNDRDFKVGDILVLNEYRPRSKKYTGSNCVMVVTYMTHGGEWGLPCDLCVLSLAEPLIAAPKQKERA